MIWIISYFTILSLSFWSLSWVVHDNSPLSDVSDSTQIIGCFIYTCLVHLWLFVCQTVVKEFRDSTTIIVLGIIYFIITHIIGITISLNLVTFDITNVITLPIGIFLYLITFVVINRTPEKQKEELEEMNRKAMQQDGIMTKQELKSWFLSQLDSLEESQSMVDYLERLEEIKKEIETK